MLTSRRVNCYILIGGRSRRMGQSKATLFLDRIAAAARPLFDEVIAVQRAGGEMVNLPTIFEAPHEHDGAIYGIARALDDARGRCFILAVDYPNITTEMLELVRNDGRIPMWNGEPQPLCAIWDFGLRERIARRIENNRRDVRGLIAEAGLEMIPEPVLRARFPGEPLANVNTPEEREEAERHGSR